MRQRGEAGAGDEQAPHLILLDLKLPKVTGLEVLAQIRDAQRTRMVPVVVFTSSNEDRDLVEAYRRGANAYIRKPVDFHALTKARPRRSRGPWTAPVTPTPPTPRAPARYFFGVAGVILGASFAPLSATTVPFLSLHSFAVVSVQPLPLQLF